MQYCVISLTLELPDEIYMTSEWSCSASNGYCLRSCCTLCGNNFFVLWQYINFMSQQATTGSLCQAKQCLIGFWSMATPPEACFNLPFFFQQHLERNGGDYIPPVVPRWFYPHGLWEYAADSHGPCCPAALFDCWQTLSCCCWDFLLYHCWDKPRFKGNYDNTNQINCLLHKPGHSWDSKQCIRKASYLQRHKIKTVYLERNWIK